MISKFYYKVLFLYFLNHPSIIVMAGFLFAGFVFLRNGNNIKVWHSFCSYLFMFCASAKCESAQLLPCFQNGKNDPEPSNSSEQWKPSYDKRSVSTLFFHSHITSSISCCKLTKSLCTPRVSTLVGRVQECDRSIMLLGSPVSSSPICTPIKYGYSC